MKEIVTQTEGFTEFPRPLHTYTDLKRVLNELNGPKKPPNKEGCMLPTMPLGKKKVENSQRFPTGIPCSKAHPGTDSSTQALVLVGNKWTADALSEIGVSTQGGNSIEREAPNSWMFFFHGKTENHMDDFGVHKNDLGNLCMYDDNI